MVTDRLIGLSRGAAEQLGIADGVTAVRVRRTNPPAAERRLLRAGEPVRERIATPQSLLAILRRSEEHTSELQSIMRISYAVFCLKNNNQKKIANSNSTRQTRHLIP